MKKSGVILFVAVAAVLVAAGLRSPYSAAQNKGQKGVLMAYYIDNVGDTVYYDQLPPVWCFPKGTRREKKDWRNYYRLVYNFNKVYPYALAGKKMMAQVDSVLAHDVSKRSERNNRLLTVTILFLTRIHFQSL